MSSDWLETFFQFIQIGGPAIGALLILSTVLMTLVFLKLVLFIQAGLFSSKATVQTTQILSLCKAKDYESALKIARGSTGPTNSILAKYCQDLNNNLIPIGSELLDEYSRLAHTKLNQLRHYLRPIEVIANLAPLVGLLGTVLGMIEAFQAMEVAGKKVDPSVLSGGIWQALLTTAVGLTVAIPATIFYNWFDRRVDRCAEQMQEAISELLSIQTLNKLHHTAA